MTALRPPLGLPQLPDNLAPLFEENTEFPRWATEALVLDAWGRSAITTLKAARVLGLDEEAFERLAEGRHVSRWTLDLVLEDVAAAEKAAGLRATR